MKKYVPWIMLILGLLFLGGKVYAYDPNFSYDNPCSEESVMRVLYLVSIIILIIKVAVPFLLVVTGIIDLIKIVVGKPDDLTKQLIVFAKRCLAGVLIFITPSIVFAVFRILDDAIKYKDIENKYQSCIACLQDNGQCNFKKYGE